MVKGTQRWGAILLGLSAILYLVAAVIGGLNLAYLGTALIFALVAAGLLQGRRWFAHLAFLFALIAISFAVTGIWAHGGPPGWIFAGIATANLLAAVALFMTLWKSPAAA